MIKKIMIVPWFGKLPEWMDEYWANVEEFLKPQGYDFLFVTNLKLFKKRVKEKLGIECNIIPGTGKVHDFRPALGHIFEDEIAGYDYWGHTDFDCVYGRVEKWVTDEYLKQLNIHSNHHSYVCGPWTLYSNIPYVKGLYQLEPDWKSIMKQKASFGWAEKEFSRIIEDQCQQAIINLEYTFWQGRAHSDENIYLRDGKLYEGEEEIMMYHFRHSKKWPKGCAQ